MRIATIAMALAMAAGSTAVFAQDAGTGPILIKLEIAGETKYATPMIPDAVPGTYLYEREGEPIIELGAGNEGRFQPHGVPSIPIQYWLETDEKGVLYKRSGEGNPNYLHILVVQYGPGGGGNYPEGSYDRWQWIHDVEGGCAIILGERYKCD